MDGNGRWATKRNLPRDAGHIEGLKAVKRIVRLAAYMPEVDTLTLYVFSTENWKRPKVEVNYLMNLLASRLSSEIKFFKEHSIRILVRGDITALPEAAQKSIKLSIESTKDCKNVTCVLAINYGGQDEVARAVNRFISKNPGKTLTTEDIQNNLDLPQISAPDLIVRSAGEHRLSNFLLWDSAYAEFLSIETLWPDFDKEELELSVNTLKSRVRRFGGV